MTHRLVEDLGTTEVPASLVEDADAFRILLLQADPHSPVVPQRIWQRAYDAGVVLIVVPGQSGSYVISADEFIERRTDHVSGAGYVIPTVAMTVLATAEPSYRDYLMTDVAETEETEPVDPLDTTNFVHLHTHTEYSQLDGLSTWKEVFDTVSADPNGGGAVGSSDHGNCAGHPEQQKMADEYGMKPIFGMEAYFVPDRHRRVRHWYELDGVEINTEHLTEAEKKKVERKSDAREVKTEYTHITLWAMDDVGLRNLWAMSTEAYRDGLYDGKPRLDWETLERFAEGVLCGSGCLRGPVSRPLADSHDPDEVGFPAEALDAARNALLRLQGIFGDRLYMEIHTNHLPAQVEVNQQLGVWCRDYGIQPLAAVDSHYSVPEHQIVHAAWLAMQTDKVLGEDSTLFQGDQQYHLKTCEEVVESLIRQGFDDEFVHEAVANTVGLAKRCTARIKGETTTPTFSKASTDHPDPVKRDEERLREICEANWKRKVIGKPKPEAEYRARFEREMKLLIEKGFCGYFLICWDYVAWAKRQGCLVGPGRGSGGGSIVAYLADIVEVDAVDANLIFERFLTEGRKSLPDFDIDFPSSWRGRITTYVKERWGEEYVANIGTISRLRSKAAINDTVRVLKPILPYEVPFTDFEVLKKTIEAADAPLAGKHLPWDEFKAQYSDMYDPMEAAYPDIFLVVDVIMDRVKTYGKHAAGLVISTSTPLTDLPMRLAKDNNTGTEVMVSQFDMGALEELGYVKFDFLTLRTLDTLQVCLDLIDEKFGFRINPYDWKEELADPQVWEEVSAGRTLGLFQIETASGTRLTKRMEPRSIYDLAAVMTVVRPGPMRSGLTESYLRRRAGLEPVTYLDPRMEEFLGDTYGSMIYQEQVMAACMTLAGYDSTEADGVRKLLGKKQVEKVVAAGEEFVRRAVEHGGTDRIVAETLWAQMAEFAKYGFNKAHAFAYAVLGYWCAFLRFHYPVEFLVAALSTVDSDRIPDFIEDCRRSGYSIVPPNVNLSKVEFSANGMEIIYGLSMVKGIGTVTAEQIVAKSPYETIEDFKTRAVDGNDKVTNGHLRTLVEVGALDGIVPNRRALEQQLSLEAEGHFRHCVHKLPGATGTVREEVCGFDWASEPDPPMLSRGRGKNKIQIPKDPPKKCTVACRQFCAPKAISADMVRPYDNREIMQRERELLGVWITHSPFEMIPDEVLEDCFTAQQIEAAPADTVFNGIGLIEEVKKKREKASGREYAFVKVNMVDGIVEGICFSSIWEHLGDQIAEDRLGAVTIKKTPKGYQLADFMAID